MNIQECLENIRTAIYGKDVRQSIHDGIKLSHDYAESAKNVSEETNQQTKAMLSKTEDALEEADIQTKKAEAAAAAAWEAAVKAAEESGITRREFMEWWEKTKDGLEEDPAHYLKENKVDIVVSQQDIPVADRKDKTFYFMVTGQESTGGNKAYE